MKYSSRATISGTVASWLLAVVLWTALRDSRNPRVAINSVIKESDWPEWLAMELLRDCADSGVVAYLHDGGGVSLCSPDSKMYKVDMEMNWEDQALLGLLANLRLVADAGKTSSGGPIGGFYPFCEASTEEVRYLTVVASSRSLVTDLYLIAFMSWQVRLDATYVVIQQATGTKLHALDEAELPPARRCSPNSKTSGRIVVQASNISQSARPRWLADDDDSGLSSDALKGFFADPTFQPELIVIANGQSDIDTTYHLVDAAIPFSACGSMIHLVSVSDTPDVDGKQIEDPVHGGRWASVVDPNKTTSRDCHGFWLSPVTHSSSHSELHLPHGTTEFYKVERFSFPDNSEELH